MGQSRGRGTDRTSRDRVGTSADSTAPTSSASVAAAPPEVSSSQPPSSGANGIVVAAVFRAQAGAWAHALVDAAYAAPRTDGQHRSVTDQTLRLSADEARQVTAELGEVLRGWSERTRGRDPERRTYSYLGVLQPLPDDGPGQVTS